MPTIAVEVSPQMAHWLDQLVATGLFGFTIADAAADLIARSLEAQLLGGLIRRTFHGESIGPILAPVEVGALSVARAGEPEPGRVGPDAGGGASQAVAPTADPEVARPSRLPRPQVPKAAMKDGARVCPTPRCGAALRIDNRSGVCSKCRVGLTKHLKPVVAVTHAPEPGKRVAPTTVHQLPDGSWIIRDANGNRMTKRDTEAEARAFSDSFNAGKDGKGAPAPDKFRVAKA